MTQPRPTDLELMQFADGELDASRARQVEQWLDGSADGRAVLATFEELGRLVREHASESAQQAGADGIADAVMARLEADEPPGGRVIPLHAERSQAGFIGYALGGLVLAAAAALVVWQVAGHPLAPAASNTPSAVPSRPELALALAPVTDPEDREPGVSVDAIEFGAHAGTIFYVPNDTGTTTVVWLTDDDTGEGK
jgi:anti-sigma factor RsiW